MESRAKIFEELRRETEYFSSHTQAQYFAHASDYLDFVGPNRDWRDRDVLYDYRRKLEKRGIAQSHTNYIIRGPVGCLFRAHGLRLPIKLPKTKVSLIDLSARVSFTTDEIISLIKAALASGDKMWQNIMVFSTIYGLRASEIRAIRKEDVHPKKKTFVVHTVKGGLLREHLVPKEIQPYILNYDYAFPLSESAIYLIFHEIAKVAGIKRMPRKVYHAVRHGLASEMIYGVKIHDATVYQFLRWRAGGMLGIYATPHQPHIDEEIFKNHPFLKYWS